MEPRPYTHMHHKVKTNGSIFVGLAAAKQLMMQHIQWVVCFHFLKVLLVDNLETIQHVIDDLTYKVQSSEIIKCQSMGTVTAV